MASLNKTYLWSPHEALILKVTKHFAQDMINAIPPKEVASGKVYCNGGGGALGHPGVYINLVSCLAVQIFS